MSGKGRNKQQARRIPRVVRRIPRDNSGRILPQHKGQPRKGKRRSASENMGVHVSNNFNEKETNDDSSRSVRLAGTVLGHGG